MTIEERDALLAPYSQEKSNGGVKAFSNVPSAVIEKLAENEFLDLEPWNDCPGNKVFLEFLKRFPYFTAHGYAVEAERPDCRVTIEGLACEAPFSDLVRDYFIAEFRQADVFEWVGHLYCWYD